MALIFTDVKRFNIKNSGGMRRAIIDITFDNAYATGGWAVLASDVKMSIVYGMVAIGAQVGAAVGAVFGWDPATAPNGKLLAYKSNTAALFQEIGAADLNTRVVRFEVIGG
mgnify:CR=1 FL=1